MRFACQPFRDFNHCSYYLSSLVFFWNLGANLHDLIAFHSTCLQRQHHMNNSGICCQPKIVSYYYLKGHWVTIGKTWENTFLDIITGAGHSCGGTLCHILLLKWKLLWGCPDEDFLEGAFYIVRIKGFSLMVRISLTDIAIWELTVNITLIQSTFFSSSNWMLFPHF